jgi:hypothetical protein
MREKRRNPPADPTVWLSLEEAAGCLGVTQWTVLRWAKDGDPRLPGYKVWDDSTDKLGRFRFKKQDVDALVNAGSGEVPVPLAEDSEQVTGPAGGGHAG